MLTIDNIRIRYGNSSSYVLKDLFLSLEPGIHGLVGLNGAGKTTLLNAIYRFIPINEGRITFNGSPLRRADIAYLEMDNYFYPQMTGHEYLQLFTAPPGAPFDQSGWQQLFSLPLDDITENYSTGMRKKLALMAVIKTGKPIILLDEPFNGLDLEGVRLLTMILNHLRSAGNGKTIIITSHIYETLADSCDCIHYLSEGRILRRYSRHEFSLLRDELNTLISERASELIQRLLPNS
ncbi:MAG: ATP-binding cassette domain-containing protein [Tannerellaceae bacterium]|jgi:ABC-2 type transport system ATP-binding protein|nr:ATP-binding cassette domain-containing protein [Tannerellaceae bacterium]